MFVGEVSSQLVLEGQGAGAEGVAGVEHLDEHIGGVDDFVEFVPDASALSGGHAFVALLGSVELIQVA